MDNSIAAILDRVVAALSPVAGVEAVVLGGSRARGTHTDASDVDIGIYYDAEVLDLAALAEAAQSIDDGRRPDLITAPGGWGQWVNGGGWLVIDGRHVDWLLRDTARVARSVAECEEGIVSAHYQTGHPHAYLNVMYRGELAVCQLLLSKGERVPSLKRAAQHYPPRLQRALIDFFSFEARFSLMFAQACVTSDDAYYLTAHIVRAVSALNQVLFALNRQYCLNEKKAVRMIDRFAIKPDDYKSRVDQLFALCGVDDERATAILGALVDEIARLVA